MITTNHATDRWQQRFPEFNIHAEYAASRCLSKGRNYRRAIRNLRAKHSDKLLKNGGTHYMLLSKRSGAVFIMDKGEVVITILKIETPC